MFFGPLAILIPKVAVIGSHVVQFLLHIYSSIITVLSSFLTIISQHFNWASAHDNCGFFQFSLIWNSVNNSFSLCTFINAYFNQISKTVRNGAQLSYWHFLPPGRELFNFNVWEYERHEEWVSLSACHGPNHRSMAKIVFLIVICLSHQLRRSTVFFSHWIK